jgi:CheY-like chemotaxis protein
MVCDPKQEGLTVPRILVVDDDPQICSSVRAWLEGGGHQVILADGGISGLSALEKKGVFDVMIVDIFMPGMNGFESIRAFHQRAPTVPIIAISGLMFRDHQTPAPDFLRMALNLGAAYCLRKPFKPSELLAAVEHCLSGAAANVLHLSPLHEDAHRARARP